MGAEEASASAKEMNRDIGQKINEQRDALLLDNAWTGNRERETELLNAYTALQEAFEEAVVALGQIKLKNPEDTDRMQKEFGQQVANALHTLKNNLKSTQYSPILIEQTCEEIEQLTGVIAKGAPEEHFWTATAVDQWIFRLQNENTISVLRALAATLQQEKTQLKERSDEQSTATPTASVQKTARDIIAQADKHAGKTVTVPGTGETWVFKN